MNATTVLIVDDEPLARRRLERLLAVRSDVKIVGEAGDVQQAVDAVRKLRPELMLLDIHMPGGNGFDVLDALGDATPAIIFVTAFDHYALMAFEQNAVDYVTKPVEEGRLDLALRRALERLGAGGEQLRELQGTIATLRQALRQAERPTTQFWIKTRIEFVRIGSNRIQRIHADRDYVRLHADGESYLYGESLASLERRLDPAEFIRIHRSVIVRRDAIERLRVAPYASLIAVLSDGAEVRVGRSYARTVKAELGRGG